MRFFPSFRDFRDKISLNLGLSPESTKNPNYSTFYLGGSNLFAFYKFCSHYLVPVSELPFASTGRISS